MSAIKAANAPKFELRFLLPNFWHIWVGVFILYIITWFPYSVILKIGGLFGKLLAVIVPKRVSIAKQNIRLTFPNWTQAQVDDVFEQNIKRTGMALFETAMGWWWPHWRVRKHIEFEGFEHVEAILKSGRGVFGLAIHNVFAEFACRAVGYKHPSIAFYRKHNNPLMDFLQYRGRNRANKYLIHKRNSKALIDALNSSELCVYLPDQDYGPAQSIFVPFGGVDKAATTTATLMFVERANCVPLLILPTYTPMGYKIKFYPALDFLADNNKERALTRLNEELLNLVKEQPESYLWMHKRYKTRPDSEPQSLYQ